MPLLVDLPDEEDILPPPPVPQTAPARQPTMWRFRFPWRKTAVGAPTYNNDLLIENQTALAWRAWHGYHFLGTLEPEGSLCVQLVKSGVLSARPDAADPGTEYILVQLTEAAYSVQIAPVSGAEGLLYEWRLLEETTSNYGDPAMELTEDTLIEDLNLSATTENALKRLGITTVSQILNMDLKDLPSIHSFGEKSYREVWERLRRWKRRP